MPAGATIGHGPAGEAWCATRQTAERWLLDGDPTKVPQEAISKTFRHACGMVDKQDPVAPDDVQAAAALFFYRAAVVSRAKGDRQALVASVLNMLSCLHCLHDSSPEAIAMEAEVRLEFDVTDAQTSAAARPLGS